MTASVTFAPQPAPTATSGRLFSLLSPVPAFEVYLPESANRSAVTRYIADQFKTSHQAEIHDFMPLLLSMRCQGQLKAVSGVRPAARQTLFLEQYLDRPVEDVLAQGQGAPVERQSLVEIGNLVATQKGASQLVFLMLTALLHRCGFKWVVFTGTPVVIRGLEHLGFRLETLCDADPARLTSSKVSDWGRYYEQRPKVVAGNVPDGYRVLSGHRLYTAALALFEQQISQLAPLLCTTGLPYGTHTVCA